MITILILLASIVVISLALVVVCRDISHFNGMDPKLDSNIFGALFQRMYFVLTTLTTVGYGDISPRSVRAKIFVMIIIFFVVAIILSALNNLAVFVQEKVVKVITKKKNTEEPPQPYTVKPEPLGI